MPVYNKLFTKILDSSIWLASDATRIVWITMIAAMDEDGFCQFATVENLAARARVALDAAKKAVNQLESPEPSTANDHDDGTRIERVPGGWIVINAKKYREMVTRIIAREQTRERVRRYREKKRSNAHVTTCNAQVLNVTPSVAEAEAEASVHTRTRAREDKVIVSYEKTMEYKNILGTLFLRPVGTHWSSEEEHCLVDVIRRPLFEVELDKIQMMKLIPEKAKYFPRSLTKLLQNWTTVLDHARSPAYEDNGKSRPSNTPRSAAPDYSKGF